MEGRAAAVRGAAVDVLGDGWARERRLDGLAARAAGLAAGLYPALPYHGSGRGTTAPISVARQSPATSAVSDCGRRHVSPLLRHHAWRGTGIWPRQGNRRGQKC